MKKKPLYSVGEVATMLGLTVRQLHHWDELGLAPASRRSPAGYRIYTEHDVERLQRALVYRETGMALARIRLLLDNPASPQEHLVSQLELLLAQRETLTKKITAVEQLLEKEMTKTPVSVTERAEILGQEWHPAWDEEAAERWGDTHDWQVSQQRQARMSSSDWQEFVDRLKGIEKRCALALSSGIAPESVEGMALAEEYREALSAMFEVTHAKQVLLGRMYLADERFTSRYESLRPGLSEWLSAAINANALAHGTDPAKASWE
ncbi:MerR family transcriptional regulator [Dermabacteraceae bacterium P13077]